MTNELVKQLREWWKGPTDLLVLLGEAADEIERLCGYWLGDKLKGGSDVCHTCHAHCVVIGDKDAELTQLRGNLSLAEDGLASATQEIERLRAENGKAYEKCDRLIWLIENGEHYYGTLWREATAKDVDAVRESLNKAHANEPRASQPSAFDQSCPFQPSRDMVPHTTEDDFLHFLSYSGKRGVPHEADLQLAYYAGADVGVPTAQKSFVPLTVEIPAVACIQCGGHVFACAVCGPTVKSPTSAEAALAEADRRYRIRHADLMYADVLYALAGDLTST